MTKPTGGLILNKISFGVDVDGRTLSRAWITLRSFDFLVPDPGSLFEPKDSERALMTSVSSIKRLIELFFEAHTL